MDISKLNPYSFERYRKVIQWVRYNLEMLTHRTASRGAAALVILVGAFSLVGWLFDVETLTSIYGSITIKANASIASVSPTGLRRENMTAWV